MPLVRYLILVFCFTIAVNSASAKNKVIDSLKKALKTQVNDSLKVNTLNALSDKLQRSGNDYDSALVYAKNAELLAEKLNYNNGMAEAYRNIGRVHWKQGDLSVSMEYFEKALGLNRKMKNDNGTASNLNNIGLLYTAAGDYPKAMENFFDALTINQNIGNKLSMAHNYGNIGNVYHNQGNNTKAIEYHTRALALDEELGFKGGAADDNGNIGNIYYGLKNYPKALEFDGKALAIAKQIGNNEIIARNIGNMGIIYFAQANYPQALDYNLQSLTLNRQLGYSLGTAHNYGSIGEVYIKQKNYKLAKVYLDSSLNLSTHINDKSLTSDVYNDMSILDSATGNYTASIADFKMHIKYNDSVINEANTKKTMQAEMNYEFDQKQTATKAEQDKKDAVAEQQRKREIVIRNSLLAGFILVLALTFFIYRSYKQKQRANVIITLQKEEVDKSQKKIMDSIRYAQKIQYSLLPSAEEIKNHVTDYFVCLQPKDIVSGDFYWFHHADGLSYIAVVDCTGHGVPGACMSMLAHSFLNEVVIEKKLSKPAEILSLMHKLVFKTLHQEKGDEYSQDGMDISLLVIDHKRNSAEFAGAKNNAFVIEEQNIITLKATSKSIGGLSLIGEVEPVRQFKAETVELVKGSLLVLSTDGIFDQLNQQDEKFGKERFKTLAQSLYSLDTKQGLAITEATINQWKNAQTQQDDILFMGVRV